MGLKKYDYSSSQLLEACAVQHPIQGPSNVSVGMALDTLASLADIPDEFEGDCDGLDALCYHLSACQCEKAIVALQKVLERFKHV